MTQEPREADYGLTISEWIALVPGVLPIDAVGLWHILAAGRERFNLEGQDLVDYVRRNIVVLLDAGAIPVEGSRGTSYPWIAKHDYGSTKGEITNSIVEEWQAMAGDQGYPYGLWFALPRTDPGYIKM